MKKILVIFCFLLFLVVGVALRAKADVYGYILTITAVNNGADVKSGSTISLSDVQSGGFRYHLKVIDSTDPARVFDVDDWGISFSQGASGTGKFSISTSGSKNNLLAALSFSGEAYSGGQALSLSAQARIGSSLTNRANFALNVESILPDETPAPSATLSFIPPEAKVSETIESIAIVKIIERNAPRAAAVVIIPIALAGASSIPLVVNLLGNFFAYPILIPSWSRRKKWGVVYDARTKKPVKGARIRVYSEPDGKSKGSVITASDGTFSLIVAPGKYSITVTANGYIFPSKIVTGSTDGQYSSVYHGGAFETQGGAGSETELNISIPLDRTSTPVWDDKVIAAVHYIQKGFGLIRIPLLLIGSAFALLALYKTPSVLSYTISGFYCILWVIELRNLFRPHGYGVVIDDQRAALPLVLVRAVNDKGKIAATMVTTPGGKFSTRLSSGQYKFDAVKSGYSHLRTEPIGINRSTDFGRVRLGLDKLSRSTQNNVTVETKT